MTCTARFMPHPGIRLVYPGLWEVVTEGRVEYDIDGRQGVLIIPVGFKFDGASTPPLARLLLAPVFVLLGMTRNEMEDPASAHDRGYWAGLDKELADKIFGALLRHRAGFFSGFGRIRREWGACLAEAAVRHFGAAAYAAHRAREAREAK